MTYAGTVLVCYGTVQGSAQDSEYECLNSHLHFTLSGHILCPICHTLWEPKDLLKLNREKRDNCKESKD